MPNHSKKRRRDPVATRKRLLAAGFREMYRVGYRRADVGRILREAGVTKGALYHHFASKRSLGYAVVTEVLREWILDRWLHPVLKSPDPVAELIDLARWGERTATEHALALGCPLAVLSEELAGVDEGFRSRLGEIYAIWQAGLTERLAAARAEGLLREDVDPEVAATFVVAAWRGSIGLAKARSDREVLGSCRKGLEGYLESLRLPRSGTELE